MHLFILALPKTSDRPIPEQAVMSALQTVIANPTYSDFWHTIMQHWPGLRTLIIPNVNPPTGQPGKPQYQVPGRSCSPSTSSTTLSKEGKWNEDHSHENEMKHNPLLAHTCKKSKTAHPANVPLSRNQ